MKYRYDLHVHSVLSPCADREMTPVNIVGTAKLLGLDFVAVADHNAIENVQVAIAAGKEYGIEVVPAMELQTSEDVHVLCLFEDFGSLKAFYDSIEFPYIANRKDIFGEQQIVDEDDEVVGEMDRMLLASAAISSEDVYEKCLGFGGAAVPAHVDRDMNGMLQILGGISGGYKCVEVSPSVRERLREELQESYLLITDSDAHTLEEISCAGEIELAEYSVKAFVRKLGNGR